MYVVQVWSGHHWITSARYYTTADARMAAALRREQGHRVRIIRDCAHAAR